MWVSFIGSQFPSLIIPYNKKKVYNSKEVYLISSVSPFPRRSHTRGIDAYAGGLLPPRLTRRGVGRVKRDNGTQTLTRSQRAMWSFSTLQGCVEFLHIGQNVVGHAHPAHPTIFNFSHILSAFGVSGNYLLQEARKDEEQNKKVLTFFI